MKDGKTDKKRGKKSSKTFQLKYLFYIKEDEVNIENEFKTNGLRSNNIHSLY